MESLPNLSPPNQMAGEVPKAREGADAVSPPTPPAAGSPAPVERSGLARYSPLVTGEPAIARLVLTLEDVLPRIPTHCLQPGMHDPKRALRFALVELSAGIARGRVSVPLSMLAARYPDLFVMPTSAEEDVAVSLPLQTLVQQVGRLCAEPVAVSVPTRPAPPVHAVRSEGEKPVAPVLAATQAVFYETVKPAESPAAISPSSAPQKTDALPEKDVAPPTPAGSGESFVADSRPSAPVTIAPSTPLHRLAEPSYPIAPALTRFALGETDSAPAKPKAAPPREVEAPVPVQPGAAPPSRPTPATLPPPLAAPAADAVPIYKAPTPPPILPEPPTAPPPPSPPPLQPPRELSPPGAGSSVLKIAASVPVVRPPLLARFGPQAPVRDSPIEQPSAAIPRPVFAATAPEHKPAEPAAAPIPEVQPPPLFAAKAPEAVSAVRASAPPISVAIPPPAAPAIIAAAQASALVSTPKAPAGPRTGPPAGRALDQETLQTIFMTDEPLDLAKICKLSAELPGLTGCMLVIGENATSAGERPPGLDGRSLRDLSRHLAATANPFSNRPAAARTFTLYGEDRALSIFVRDQLTLCVVHPARGFMPGVRERLNDVADALARSLAA